MRRTPLEDKEVTRSDKHDVACGSEQTRCDEHAQQENRTNRGSVAATRLREQRGEKSNERQCWWWFRFWASRETGGWVSGEIEERENKECERGNRERQRVRENRNKKQMRF